jgi:hypothetical protein
MMRNAAFWLFAALFLSGCASEYSWRSKVPDDMRTVSVPVFRNESEVTELGAVAARQLLREFQREGTFRIASPGNGAIEIQGIVKRTTSGTAGYNRGTGMRYSNFDLAAEVEVSVVDKVKGKVLVDNKPYRATATFTENGDYTTSRRDASGRLSEDLARQIVDDVLALKW